VAGVGRLTVWEGGDIGNQGRLRIISKEENIVQIPKKKSGGGRLSEEGGKLPSHKRTNLRENQLHSEMVPDLKGEKKV